MRKPGGRTDALALAGLACATLLVCSPLLLHPTGFVPPNDNWRPPIASDTAESDLVSKPPSDIWNHTAHAAFDRLAIVRYGQFPFRSPYHGGGYPIFAYPEDLSLSPRLPLILAAGPWFGLKLDFILCMFLAASGTYLLVRRQMGWGVAAALVAAVTFAYGGFLVQRWLQGWVENCRAVVFPWVLYFWWRSRERRRFLVPCGLIMAVLLLDAKYGLAVLGWFMLLWTALRLDRTGGGGLATPKDETQTGQPFPPGQTRLAGGFEWPRLGLLVALIVWAALLAGVKLLPFMPLLGRHLQGGGQGWPIGWTQVLVWAAILAAFILVPMVPRGLRPKRAVLRTVAVIAVAVVVVVALCPRDDSTLPERLGRARETWDGLVSFGAPPRDFEGGLLPEGMERELTPVGWTALALAAVGLVWRVRSVGRWALLAGLLLAIDLGKAFPVDLYSSVRQLPGLNLIRNPRSHYGLYLQFCLAMLAARGTAALAAWFRGRWLRAASWACVVVSFAYLLWQTHPLYDFSVSRDLPALGSPGPYSLVAVAGDPDEQQAVLMYRNVGVQRWDSDLNDVRSAALAPALWRPGGPPNRNYRREAYFLRPDSPNSVELTRITPLEIRARVSVSEPGVLCINQIADTNWRTSHGVMSTRSRTLGVELTQPGDYEVRLRYVPVLFYWGVGISLLSLVGGTALIAFCRRDTAAPKGRSRRPANDGTPNGPPSSDGVLKGRSKENTKGSRAIDA